MVLFLNKDNLKYFTEYLNELNLCSCGQHYFDACRSFAFLCCTIYHDIIAGNGQHGDDNDTMIEPTVYIQKYEHFSNMYTHSHTTKIDNHIMTTTSNVYAYMERTTIARARVRDICTA